VKGRKIEVELSKMVIFSNFSRHISLEPLEIKPILLRVIMKCLNSFPVTPCLTLKHILC